MNSINYSFVNNEGKVLSNSKTISDAAIAARQMDVMITCGEGTPAQRVNAKAEAAAIRASMHAYVNEEESKVRRSARYNEVMAAFNDAHYEAARGRPSDREQKAYGVVTTLTDGSKGYDVELFEGTDVIRLNCIDEKAQIALLDALKRCNVDVAGA